MRPHRTGSKLGRQRGSFREKAPARVSSRHATQAEARARARTVARQAHVELIVHGRDGRIRERDSYGSGPRRSKG